jgi:hypothetical protein
MYFNRFNGKCQVAVLLIVWFASFAPAAVMWEAFNFQCITNNNPANSLTGESYLSLKMTTDNADSGGHPNGAPYSAYFYIENVSPVPMVISRILFDFPDDLSKSFTTLYNQSSTNIAMHNPNIPANPLPGGDTLYPPFDVDDAFVKLPRDSYEHGIEPGERQLIQLAFYPTIMANYGLAEAIQSGKFRVGIYADGFSGGGYESFVTVPEPATIVTLSLGILFFRRRNLV